jgi:PRTRC genetic system protein A
MQPIGYRVNADDDKMECPGELYDYHWAGNGIFIEAKNQLLSARIPITDVQTRGLSLMQPEIKFKHGKIPEIYYDFIVEQMKLTPQVESYFVVVWEDNVYKIRKPPQIAAADAVVYQAQDNVILDIHSHPAGPNGFSAIDDADEQGFKIYGVLDNRDGHHPAIFLRMGVYGYFHYLQWEDVFERRSNVFSPL